MPKTDLKLDFCSHEAARYACENWHYSKCIPVGKLVKIGVWENGAFIGCVIFSRGANKTLLTPYGLSQTEGCELTRIALKKHSSPVSRIISISLKMLKRLAPSMRLVVSFADSAQEHVGGIYQASNWIYLGMSHCADEYIFRGKRWHGRAFRKTFGSHTKYIDQGVQMVRGSSKHRYLMPLDDSMKAAVEKLRKPYPKKCAGSIDVDASVNQTEEGGSAPTPALHSSSGGDA